MQLQGKDPVVNEMHTSVKSFKAKVTLTLATLKKAPQLVKKYSKSLNDLQGEFCC